MPLVGRLGRLAPKRDSRTVQLSALRATPTLLAPPLARHWGRHYLANGEPGIEVPFSTFSNLQYGDCTCAAIGHFDQAVCVAAQSNPTVTTDMVLEAYDAISDWDRTQPSISDDGAYNLDALKWFRKQGLITAFAAIEETNRTHVQTCINLFHGVYVGADLPLAAKKQVIWDVAPPGSRDRNFDRRTWGGHAMLAVGYDAVGVWFVTWGRLQFATWEWFFTYVDESYAMIHSRLAMDESKHTPAGFLADQIIEMLDQVKG